MSSTARTNLEQPHVELSFDDEMLHLRLGDGRTAHVPLRAYDRLGRATREQLEHWEVIGEGEGIHWPDIDEDISMRGLLAYQG